MSSLDERVCEINKRMKDANTSTIFRQVVPFGEENLAAGIRMGMEALKILERVYMEEGRTLLLHVPPEDTAFQRKVGGTFSSPALLALCAPDDTPLDAFPVRELPCFSYLEEAVIPLFTSIDRLQHFIDVLEENLYVIPESNVAVLGYSADLGKTMSAGQVVVNPLPQLFLSGVFPMIKEGDDNLIFAMPMDAGQVPDEPIHSTRVVGVTFEGRQQVVASLVAGQELRLRREPYNRHDSNAIRVECLDGRQVGYINRDLARDLAPTLDKVGGTLPAQVVEVTEHGSGYSYGVEISYRLPQEDGAGNWQ